MAFTNTPQQHIIDRGENMSDALGNFINAVNTPPIPTLFFILGIIIILITPRRTK